MTSAQKNYLVQLGVPRTELAELTITAASDLISKKQQEREAQPPTGPQLKLLQVSCKWQTQPAWTIGGSHVYSTPPLIYMQSQPPA